MFDFIRFVPEIKKNGTTEIYPIFEVKKSHDLMIRGSDFYAIWVDERGLWSTDEYDAIQLIDKEIDKYADEYKQEHPYEKVKVKHLWDSRSGLIDSWHKYCQKQVKDNYHMLDEKLIFANDAPNKKDYASKRLPYPLEPGEHPAFDKIMSTLYSDEERHKIEWAIGAIVSGDSKSLQKFLVLYGAAGTGKSTVLNIIQQLFEGYWTVFDAKALGSNNNTFALEAFRTNPLVAIQHDGDLSRIEDNTLLNSLVSHEKMTVNEKFKSTYATSFKAFLFLGTNKPVKITDAKSGLIRRLIDVTPSGNKLSLKEYRQATKQIAFELGPIACYCKEVYLADPNAYDDYVPISMMGASNDFYNYIIDSYHIFLREDGTSLKAAWEMYKTYCDEAKVAYPLSQRAFKEELKNYFWEFQDRFQSTEGERIRSYYKGFRTDKFENSSGEKIDETKHSSWIRLEDGESIFDTECADCFAQYASSAETPLKKWDDVTTKLSDLDTRKLHYVKVPENHIVIDFDIRDVDGNKSLEKNLEAAGKWPATYVELSKSGAGVHLHYIYTGDPTKLSSIYEDGIEVKVFSGKTSLRRKLTQCMNNQIASISSGLPLKGEKNVVNFDSIKSEKALRTLIERNLNKEIHSSTKSSVDFIFKILDDAYNSGLKYDVSDMKNAVIEFAAGSTNQSSYCLKTVKKMKFKSEEPSVNFENKDADIVFYDVEVFPNLFLVNWKRKGENFPVVRMINPTPGDIEMLLGFKLVGFNCRRYDNHILYARLMGYTNEQLFELSQKIVDAKKGTRNNFFGEAYNLSYTDIYDFASAGNKKSLKKLEIEMGIHHQELGLPWDKPVPESMWGRVAEYCDNDVIATEAAFDYLKADWTARQILADLAGMTVNDTTNSLTTKIIFGSNKKPQGEFYYRDMSQPVIYISPEEREFLDMACPEMMDAPHIKDEHTSILPFFPGYKYEAGKSTYRGEEVGEGGYVYAEPGMYGNVALLDIASMHPHSLIAECHFGTHFTSAFRDIVEGRVSIKHEDWDAVAGMLDGKLVPYIQKVKDGELTSKELADALKTAINSVYGLTSASFENPFRDPRNIDNIVAKRGALFMIDLKHEVQKRGFTVAHIKTDSIKIPDATPEIINFVMDFGKRYGYTFEHEATYERMCLVNDAVYIAKYKDGKHAGEWTATGAQFAVPYVFKTLFSHEPIEFDDMCETKSVSTALYLDLNEQLEDVTRLEKELFVIAKGNREPERQEELKKIIADNHDYRFVGKIGLFCPIKTNCGGGRLVRESKDKLGNVKYDSATGADGYRWLESEMVKESGRAKDIDISYYDRLVDTAVETMGKYGDVTWFLSDDPYIPDSPPWDEDFVPFDVR